ncbi:MAG: NnrS family protein [Aquamicrobium sp.]|uniref:NnrS family protein n=1 Tax=Aquamicrobium sp. TaxID=1872579 RepID=UPI00349E7707|nr:NnrS family protein [Aquamicrobium sp.]
MLVPPPRPAPPLHAVLADEGFRLFFPLTALYAALWPFQWVLVFGLDLPFARVNAPGLWHAHEMIFGAFGAALIGFITTAIPEWTDTDRPRGRRLCLLAGLWGVGRLVGFLGADALNLLGAAADIGWLAALAAYVVWASWVKRTDRLLAILYWIAALLVCLVAVRYAFHLGDHALAQWWLRLAGFVFLGLLGVVLARITVPVTNQVLDPTEETSPFRPHPGRVTLAPGLVAILICGELAGFSAEVTGYLAIAAGAAFMDRAGEAFVGREAARTELMALAGSAVLAGAGLILTGAARLGAPLPEVKMLHLALMGGLGMGVLMVLSIAGLLHSGRPLGFPLSTRIGFVLLVVAVALRILPDLGAIPDLPGPLYGGAAILWAGAFLLWLRDYWPFVSSLERP